MPVYAWIAEQRDVEYFRFLLRCGCHLDDEIDVSLMVLVLIRIYLESTSNAVIIE